MFKLSTMGVGQVKGKTTVFQAGEQHVQRSSGDRDIKQLETERTVRPDLKLGRVGTGER